MGRIMCILRVLFIYLILASTSCQGYPTGEPNFIPANHSSTFPDEIFTLSSSLPRKRTILEPYAWTPNKQFKAQGQTSVDSDKNFHEASQVYEAPRFPLLSQEQLPSGLVVEEREQFIPTYPDFDTHPYPGVHSMVAPDGVLLNTELSDISSQMRDITNGGIPAPIPDPFQIQDSFPRTMDNRASVISNSDFPPEMWDFIVSYVSDDSVPELSPNTNMKTKTAQKGNPDTPQSFLGPDRWSRPTKEGYPPVVLGNVASEQVASFLQTWKPSQNLRQQLLSIATDIFDRNLILLLLKSKADPRGAMVSGTPLLHFAVRARDTELVSALLSAGADVDEAYTGTPLSHAVENCDANMIELLLKFAADVERGGTNGRSVHQMAMACENSQVLQLLLSQAKSGPLMGYVPASLSDRSRGNELSQHKSTDDTLAREPVRQLVPNNVNLFEWERETFPQTQDSGAQTIHKRRRKTVESAVKRIGPRQPKYLRRPLKSERAPRTNKTTNSLRESSTTLDVVDPSDEDQLISKASAGNWEEVEELLKNVSISHLTKKCWLYLMDAAVDANQAQILSMLATAGHGLKRSFGKGKKGLLWVAAKLGDLQLAKLAIQGGASINRKDGRATSLDLALKRKHVEISKLLLEHGARPSSLLP